MARLVLVDDHHVFREGLRAVLSTQPDMEVVGEASDSAGAYKAVEDFNPDVAVVDVSLPGTHGVAVARELQRRAPKCKVLILTMHAYGEYVEEAMAAGVAGYALKSQQAGDIMEAIRTVARGEAYWAEAIPRAVPGREGVPSEADQAAARDPLSLLSKREREIFDLVVSGLSNENMATRLFISVKTVETHRASINRKLGVHSTADLVRFAAMRGLISR